MTIRSNRPVPTERACAICGGAGTTTVAVPLTVPTHGNLSGHRVMVDFDSRALDVMGQPPYNPPRRVAAIEATAVPTVEGADMSLRVSTEAMLRVPDVLDRVGVSRRTLCRWRADGTFPQALRLGTNSIGWPRHVVDEWLANRPPAGARHP